MSDFQGGLGMKKHFYLSAIILFIACFIMTGVVSNVSATKKTKSDEAQYLVVNLQKKGKRSILKSMNMQKGYAEGNVQNQGKIDTKIKTSILFIKDRVGNILYTTPFSFPTVRTVPLAMPNSKMEEDVPAQIEVDNPEVTLVLPYFPEAKTLEVKDPGISKLTVKASIREVATLHPNSIVNKVKSPINNGKFEILILASGYNESNIDKFEQQAANIKRALLSTEPFASYTDKIEIHALNEAVDLGCKSGANNIARLMVCNDSKVVSTAAHSGYGYDEIIVVHNIDTYGGSGMRDNNDTGFKTNSYSTYTVVYDGPWTARMALHELGHSYGNLCDEYTYGEEEYTYFNCVNCRKDKSDFDKYIKGECSVGCDAKPEYFRAEDSIMLSLAIPTFNGASIKADFAPYGLEKRLQYFTSNQQPLAVKKLKVSPKKVTLKPGEGVQVAVMATYADGSQEDVTYVADWTANKENINLSQGYISAVSSDKVKVKASFGGKTISVLVNVQTPKRLTVSENSVTLQTGNSKKITLLATYKDGTTKDVTNAVVWKTSDKRVSTIENGIISANTKGMSVLTATYNNKVTKINVKVIE